MGDTSEVGAVLGLLFEKLDIETDFDKFRDKLNGYAERNFDNVKDGLYLVTYTEDLMKAFEEEKITEDLYEEESKSTPNNKRIELALTR